MNNAPEIEPAGNGLPPEVLDTLSRIQHAARERRRDAAYRKYVQTRPARTTPQDRAWIERTTPND